MSWSTITAFATTMCVAVACTTVETRTSGNLVLPDARASLPARSSASQTSVIVKSLGAVPYDGFTLPVVSPDGRFVAVQTGVAPTWPTLLGTRSGGPPRASGIEVWSLDDRGARKSFQTQKGYVLGRSADAEGFLIEAPQADGSRRIGRVRWPAGSVDATMEPDPEAPRDGLPEWIVSDARVNISPALGPGGAMAWCARDVDATDFVLVVRKGESAYEVPADEAQSWMLPTFADDGSLFALRVRDGVTELVHAETDDFDTFEQSIAVERLSLRADAQRAWQALAPQDALSAVTPGEIPRLLLLDPDLGRMAIWDPRERGLRPMSEGSFAACVGTDGLTLLADSDGVIAAPPSSRGANPAAPNANQRSTILGTDGPRIYDRGAVPRRVAGQPGTWILLVPDNRRIGIVRLTLVTPTRTAS
ncbi:MAG: hypothetical protein SGJ09_08690 [Phycisphaerae bacterium]|nr:hypothetical protein [Phycisphaerae bacterium]